MTVNNYPPQDVAPNYPPQVTTTSVVANEVAHGVAPSPVPTLSTIKLDNPPQLLLEDKSKKEGGDDESVSSLSSNDEDGDAESDTSYRNLADM